MIALPNPAAGPVRMFFTIAPASAGGAIRLVVCDVAGRLVRVLRESPASLPGRQMVQWDGRDRDGARVPSGIYGWRLTVDDREQSGRLAVIR